MEREGYIALRRKKLDQLRGKYNPEPMLCDVKPHDYVGMGFAEKLINMEDDGLVSIIELEDLENRHSHRFLRRCVRDKLKRIPECHHPGRRGAAPPYRRCHRACPRCRRSRPPARSPGSTRKPRTCRPSRYGERASNPPGWHRQPLRRRPCPGRGGFYRCVCPRFRGRARQRRCIQLPGQFRRVRTPYLQAAHPYNKLRILRAAGTRRPDPSHAPDPYLKLLFRTAGV